MNLSPHPFTLRQLQYAVAVADSLSFNKGADDCHVSQPSLSAQIAELEQVLRIKLFERDRRQVLITAAGREIVERAQTVLRETENLIETARRCCDPLTGTLRLGVIPTISPYLLPHVTPALRAAYPRLTLQWVEDKTHVLVRNLNSGAIDAAVLALEADIGDVEREVIARDPFVLVVQRTIHWQARKLPPNPPSFAMSTCCCSKTSTVSADRCSTFARAFTRAIWSFAPQVCRPSFTWY